MNESCSWSASAGRWMGIPVRIHLFLLLAVATIIGIEITYSGSPVQIGLGTSLITVGILFISILVHEAGHLLTVSNLGGHVNRILLMPWGGNSDFALPPTNQARAVVFLAGPFVNGAIFAFCATLLIQSNNAELAALTNPFRPHEFDVGQWQVSLIKIVAWVNFQLMLVNLIPCYPFDGANIVRSLIDALNADLPKLRVESAIMVMGHAVAFTMIGLAWLVRDYSPGPFAFAWLFMALSGISLVFAARYSFFEEMKISDMEWDQSPDMNYESFYDDSSSFDFANEHENSAYSQWLLEKQEERLHEELQREQEEDRRADEILQKLHNGGLSSLSEEERTILNRVSARLRRRRQQGV